MNPSQQRKFIRDMVDRITDADLVRLAEVAAAYLPPEDADRLFGQGVGITDARLKQLAVEHGVRARRYGADYYQIIGWYKDPSDPPRKVRSVVRHLFHADRLPFVNEAQVIERIAVVVAELKKRKAAAQRSDVDLPHEDTENRG